MRWVSWSLERFPASRGATWGRDSVIRGGPLYSEPQFPPLENGLDKRKPCGALVVVVIFRVVMKIPRSSGEEKGGLGRGTC